MTDQEINIKIAEACGMEILPYNPKRSDPRYKGLEQHIPDYCNDLNAMREAENVLDDAQYLTWGGILCDEAERDGTEARGVASATARQRAESFIKTIEA